MPRRKIGAKNLRKLLFREQKSRHAMEEFGPGMVEFTVCPEGGEVYYRKHWYHSMENVGRITEKKKIVFKLCPFHLMVKNKQYEGELLIEGVPAKYRSELIRLIENSGERGWRLDPMDRIIKIENKSDTIRVELSENQLAQKIANKIRDRFKKTTREVRRGRRTSDVVSIKISFPKK
jgi:hypothetical protein